MAAILRKELADAFSSLRCFVLFLMVFLVSALALYSANQGIRGNVTEGFVFLGLYTSQPSNWGQIAVLVNYLNIISLIFVPLIGIVLGFDAINRERTGGTLSRIISQPVYRDSVINGKFLAGMVILSIMMTSSILLVGGYGLMMIGVPPTPEEIIRLFIYLVFIIIYGAFWIGLSILFSIVFRSLATSVITSVGIWIFLSFGISIITSLVGDVANILIWFSPSQMFGSAAMAILHPLVRTFGAMTQSQMAFMMPNPLSLGQSMVLVWPYLTGLISLSVICFAISYVLFMRQEIRAT